MNDWLVFNGVCQACFAGSVMRYSCGINTAKKWDDLLTIPNWAYTLNYLRSGYVNSAFQQKRYGVIGSLGPRHLNDFVSYEDDPKIWWKRMRQLYRDLKADGI